ncbi:MAG: hypothetical protein J6R08_06605, partial [Opitutales bacterium]|nr:hypothetical protein [Opitutales bacterium]
MKKQSYLYMLAASALFLAGNTFAANYEYTPGASSEGMAWSTVSWTGATPEEPLPQSASSVLVNIDDADNPFVVDGAYTIGNFTANGYSYVLIDGEGKSLTTTLTSAPYGDVVLNNNSSLLVQNGASITLANGMSLKVRDNSSAVFDNATFTGGLYETVNSLTFRNGATWNAKGYQAQMQNTNILFEDSSLLGGLNFGDGQKGANSKHFVLDNSTWNANNGGVNIAGVVEVLNGSSISNTPHFNIGHDGNMSAGLYKLVVRGTSAEKRSSVSGSNLWLNVGAGSQSIMSFEGYTDATFGGANTTAKYTGGDMSIVFSGTSNNFTMGNYVNFGSSRDNNLLASGNWIITTAQKDELDVETFATNTTFTETSNFAIKGSKAEGGSTIVAGIDWAGATNTFSVASNTAIDHDLGAGGTSLKYITVRDGAEMNLHNTYVGSEETSSASGKSGTARLTATGSDTTLNISGSLNLRNSIYSDATTQNFVTVSDGAAMTVGAINIATNSASAGGKSVFEISGADSSVTFSSISIGNTGAIGGEGTLKISNGATFAIRSLAINANSSTSENAQFGVLVDNATITGEWKMGAGSKSKFLTLQNGSTWNANKGGINTAGTVSVLESSISNSEHFNVGWENGQVSG